MSGHDEKPDSPGPTRGAVRVLIADDSYLFREGLRQLLALSDEVEVVSTCADEPEAVAAVEADPPDVVISDIRMPPGLSDEGVRLAERWRRTHPRVGVVLLSQEGNVVLAARLFEGGAAGRAYLLKDRVHDLDNLVSTVRAVADGECRVDPVLVERLVRGHHPTGSILDALTPRQRELLADVAGGKSNLAIARDRFLTQRAVEKHVSEIFTRLDISGDADVSRRVRATLLYLDALQL